MTEKDLLKYIRQGFPRPTFVTVRVLREVFPPQEADLFTNLCLSLGACRPVETISTKTKFERFCKENNLYSAYRLEKDIYRVQFIGI